MDQSIKYNLRNPAFLDDIGYSIINRQYPCIEDRMVGVSQFGKNGVQINNGQPNQDEFNSDKKKNKNIFTKFIIGGAIVGLGILLFKKGGAILSGAKNLFTKLLSKIKK